MDESISYLHFPKDFFQLLFTADLVDAILEETVNYCSFSLEKDELLTVLGILIASGVVYLPRRRMYWSKNTLLNNASISQSISLARFEAIFSHLHFTREVASTTNKYFKVQMSLDHLNKTFMKYEPASHFFSVDECIVPYYGRHNSKQFIKGKPVRSENTESIIC